MRRAAVPRCRAGAAPETSVDLSQADLRPPPSPRAALVRPTVHKPRSCGNPPAELWQLSAQRGHDAFGPSATATRGLQVTMARQATMLSPISFPKSERRQRFGVREVLSARGFPTPLKTTTKKERLRIAQTSRRRIGSDRISVLVGLISVRRYRWARGLTLALATYLVSLRDDGRQPRTIDRPE